MEALSIIILAVAVTSSYLRGYEKGRWDTIDEFADSIEKAINEDIK